MKQLVSHVRIGKKKMKSKYLDRTKMGGSKEKSTDRQVEAGLEKFTFLTVSDWVKNESINNG